MALTEIEIPTAHSQIPHAQPRFDRDHKEIPYGFQPLDLTLMDTASGVFVIAAMGTQGVMVRSPAGEWQTLAIAEATPLK